MSIDERMEDPSRFIDGGAFIHRDQVIKDTLDVILRGVEKKDDDYAILKAISKYVARIGQKDNPKKFRKRTASQILQLDKKKVTGSTDRAIVFCALAREAGIATRYVEAVREDQLARQAGIATRYVETIQDDQPDYVPSEELIRNLRRLRTNVGYVQILGQRLRKDELDLDYVSSEAWAIWREYAKGNSFEAPEDFDKDKFVSIMFPEEITGHVFVDVFIKGKDGSKDKWKIYDPQTGPTDGKYEVDGVSFEVIGKGLDFGEIHIKTKAGYIEKPVNVQEPQVGLEEYMKNSG